MKSLLFKTHEICKKWDDKQISDFDLITGLRDIINEMSDMLIKCETEKVELECEVMSLKDMVYRSSEAIDLLKKENSELIERIENVRN